MKSIYGVIKKFMEMDLPILMNTMERLSNIKYNVISVGLFLSKYLIVIGEEEDALRVNMKSCGYTPEEKQ